MIPDFAVQPKDNKGGPESDRVVALLKSSQRIEPIIIGLQALKRAASEDSVSTTGTVHYFLQIGTVPDVPGKILVINVVRRVYKDGKDKQSTIASRFQSKAALKKLYSWPELNLKLEEFADGPGYVVCPEWLKQRDHKFGIRYFEEDCGLVEGLQPVVKPSAVVPLLLSYAYTPFSILTVSAPEIGEWGNKCDYVVKMNLVTSLDEQFYKAVQEEIWVDFERFKRLEEKRAEKMKSE